LPKEGSDLYDSFGGSRRRVDLSAGDSQEYAEDRPVCCRPNAVHIQVTGTGEVRVWSQPEQSDE
jgi:hypothetical protein